MFKTDLPAILNAWRYWFPHDALPAPSGHGSSAILIVTSGFGSGYTFALAVLLALYYDAAQIPLFAEAATLIPTTGSSSYHISAGWGVFRYHRCAFALPDRK